MNPQEDLTIKLNHIILIQGFDHLSMVELAKKAGVSRAKLYIYFKNKDEIVTAVVNRRYRFIREHAVPVSATADNLVATMLNAFLLMGSMTTKFTTELKQKHPQLFRELDQTDQQYYQNLKSYLQQAQQRGLVYAKVDSEYLIFQSQATVHSILTAVQTGQLSLLQGEQFLKQGFDFQLHALITSPHPKDSPAVRQLQKSILHEYYATYSLVEPI